MASEAERYEVPLRDRARLADLCGHRLSAPARDPLVGVWVDGGQVISPAPAPRTYWIATPGGEWRLYRADDGKLRLIS
jgi:hypothetical protein